jgi:tetratricopeptide (TPR) repeat protein
MYNIIPLVLILLSLAVIIVVIARKFAVLANLNIQTIQAEREAKFKEQIISNRLKRIILKWQSRVKRAIAPIGENTASFFRWFYNKLWEVKNSYMHETPLDQAGSTAMVDKLFNEADELWRAGRLQEMEKKLIEVISCEPKCIRAFRELGGVYLEQKSYHEAEETFKHALKLIDDWASENLLTTAGGSDKAAEKFDPENQRAGVYFDLTLVYKAQEQYDAAIIAAKKALLAEPNNPRYLDTMLELSIIKKDKIPAIDYFDKLLKVNPENNKLEDFKKQIELL